MWFVDTDTIKQYQKDGTPISKLNTCDVDELSTDILNVTEDKLSTIQHHFQEDT